MKTRILQHTNEVSKESYYTVQVQFSYLYFYKWWETLTTFQPNGELNTFVKDSRIFMTIEEAEKYLHEYLVRTAKIKTTIVKEN